MKQNIDKYWFYVILTIIMLCMTACESSDVQQANVVIWPDTDMDPYAESMDSYLYFDEESTDSYDGQNPVESTESYPAEDYTEQGQLLWNIVLAETIEMLKQHENLLFTPSESTLQEAYDYLKAVSPKALKNEYERNLRVRYISIYDALYTLNRNNSEVFRSMGKAQQFADALIGEQEDLFQMAEDDFENVYGSQQVSAMFDLFFENYESGFTPQVTEWTEPGNHAVIQVYPESGDPAWTVYFKRENSGGVWKIDGRGF